MKILVTGGTGFIGSHVCEALLEKGFSVVCVDNFDDYYSLKIKERNIRGCLKNKNFKSYKKDITNYDDMKKVFEENGITKIVHLAAKAGVRASFENPELYKKVNVEGTRNLLKLAKEFGVKNFVFGSSSSVYGGNKKIPFSEEDETRDQISPYASSKKEAEILCREYSEKYGLNVVCLRFFTVYGPRGRPDMAVYKFTKLVNEGKEIPVYGNIGSKRDYTFIMDAVDGILSALDKELGFEIINLGDSNSIELRYLISLIEKEVGKKAKVKKMERQKGDVDITFADISKAKKLLEYRPKTFIIGSIITIITILLLVLYFGYSIYKNKKVSKNIEI